MKNKIIILICSILSIGLVSVGVYGLYFNNNDSDNVVNKVFNSNKNDKKNEPVDHEFNKMKEFSLDSDKVSVKKKDAVVSGEINPDARIKDNGEVEKKGSVKNMSCSSLPNSRVYIPNTKTYSKISNKGKLGTFSNNGELNLPDTPFVSTRWTGGANVKDKEGTILIAAHRAYSGYYGVFNNLVKLGQGDIACVSDSKGNMKKFAIESLKSYDKNSLPQDLFKDAKKGDKRLVLITCGGSLTKFADGRYSYEKNVVAIFKEIK